MKKKNLIMLVATMLFLLAILLPYIIDELYYLNPICDFFDVSYEPSDLLSYYGSVLIALGTFSLGIATFVQNKKAQEKTEEVNRLSLELQKKSMDMAEEQYKRGQDNNGGNSSTNPKFEIKLSGYSGCYANLRLSVKNVTSGIVSNLSVIEVKFVNSNNDIIRKVYTGQFEKRSLVGAQETLVKTNTPEMAIRTQEKYRSRISYYKNVTLEFSFSCEDETGAVHYYRAKLPIPTTEKYCKEYFDVQKVG